MLPDALARLENKPKTALREIGKILAVDMKNKAPKRTGKLRRGIGYWYRSRAGDVQIGSKAWHSAIVERRVKTYIMGTYARRRAWISQVMETAVRAVGDGRRRRA